MAAILCFPVTALPKASGCVHPLARDALAKSKAFERGAETRPFKSGLCRDSSTQVMNLREKK